MNEERDKGGDEGAFLHPSRFLDRGRHNRPSRFQRIPSLGLKGKKDARREGEKMKLTSPRLRTTTTTTAGSSHAQRRSAVACVQHTGPRLLACRSSVLKAAPRNRQQVGAQCSRTSFFCFCGVCFSVFLFLLLPLFKFVHISRKYLKVLRQLGMFVRNRALTLRWCWRLACFFFRQRLYRNTRSQTNLGFIKKNCQVVRWTATSGDLALRCDRPVCPGWNYTGCSELSPAGRSVTLRGSRVISAPV